MRILFVNHTSEFSGAEVALLRLVGALPGEVERAVACPSDGPLVDQLAETGIEHLEIPGTRLSFKLRPKQTAAGLRDLGRSVLALRRQVRRWSPDVVHANSTRAGLLAARVRGSKPPALVVQVHDILPQSAAGTLVRRLLAHSSERVVTVSDAATRAFNRGLTGAPATTLRISFDQQRFQPDGHDPLATRRALGIPEHAPLLGQIAQITPWKGQLAAIEALAVLRRSHPDAQLVLVGDIAFAGPTVRYDNAAYARRLHSRVGELGIDHAVHFLGRRTDVPQIMAALDLMVLPSWEEPFGTVVAETMAVGTVPLVTDEGGPCELVEDGVTGRVLPPRDPEAWARAAAELLDDPGRRREMGRRAVGAVSHLTDEAYAERALEVYEEALGALRR